MKTACALLFTTLLATLTAATARGWQSEVRTEIQTLEAPEPEVEHKDYNHNFKVGFSVALTEDWAAISDLAVHSGNGEVYMYRRATSGWFFHQKIEGEYATEFGLKIAMDGDTLVVAARRWSDSLGKVFVYHLSNGMWLPHQEIIPPDLSHSIWPVFGSGLDVQGDVLAIGAPGVDQPVDDGGEVFFYEREGQEWQLAARFQLELTQEVIDRKVFFLGNSVAIDGERIAVGASRRYGRALIYEKSGGVWRHAATVGPLQDSGERRDFGLSLDLEGNTLVVGEPSTSSNDYPRGLAYAFELDAGGVWQRVQTLRASDGFSGGEFGDAFGVSVGVRNGRILVGSPHGNLGGYKTGTVYLFERTSAGWPAYEDARFVAAESDGYFEFLGISIAHQGDLFLSGASAASVDGVEEGRVYVFPWDIGTIYCDDPLTGPKLRLSGQASTEAANLTLVLSGACPRSIATFLIAPHRGTTLFGSHSSCLGVPLTRIGHAIVGIDGAVYYRLDFGSPWASQRLLAGSTWYVQAAQGFAGQNATRLELSNAVSLTLE